MLEEAWCATEVATPSSESGPRYLWHLCKYASQIFYSGGHNWWPTTWTALQIEYRLHGALPCFPIVAHSQSLSMAGILRQAHFCEMGLKGSPFALLRTLLEPQQRESKTFPTSISYPAPAEISPLSRWDGSPSLPWLSVFPHRHFFSKYLHI